MADNPYTRETTVTILELVPDRENLPICVGWKQDGQQCSFHASFNQNGLPLCGVHMGKVSTLFMPEKKRRKNGRSVHTNRRPR